MAAVKILLEKGANPNAQDVHGSPPLLYTKVKPNQEILFFKTVANKDVVKLTTVKQRPLWRFFPLREKEEKQQAKVNRQRLAEIEALRGASAEEAALIVQRQLAEKALNREITYSDISPEKWEQGLKMYKLPEHLMGHLLAMGELHRTGRYDRQADGVQRLTGRPAMGVREFVSLYAEEFGGRRS